MSALWHGQEESVETAMKGDGIEMNVEMGAKAWLGALMMIGALAMNAGAADRLWDKTSLQQMYMNFLAGEGFRPQVDEDGDIMFKKEGRTYYVMVNAKDTGYFCLAFPGIWQIDDEEERGRVLIAADEANRNCKVAKICIMGGKHVWVNVELFVAEPEDFKGVFARALAASDYAATLFWNKME